MNSQTLRQNINENRITFFRLKWFKVNAYKKYKLFDLLRCLSTSLGLCLYRIDQVDNILDIVHCKVAQAQSD